MITHYRIPDRVFVDLTAHASSAETIDLLRGSQLSKHELLLLHAAHAAERWPETRHARDVLFEAQRVDPQACAELLVSPFVGAWAARCARAPGDPSRAAGTPLAGLTGLAAAAAARAGLTVTLTLSPADGQVNLPTMGVFVPGGDTDRPVRATVRDGVIGFDPPDGRWLPIRRLTATAAGRTLTVMLDDVNPDRDCYRQPLEARLTPDAVAAWAAILGDAWTILVEHVPGRADELIGGLRSLVPLSTADAAPGLSATSRTAFGALGLTLPAQPEHLAATLVHEFQHSKLSAFLDLIPLYDPAPTDVYFAPWRPDPRPIGGLLQGAYAFHAVSEFWWAVHGRTGIDSDALRHFAELREQVNLTLGTLSTSPHLHEDGRILLTGLIDAHARLMAIPVPETIASAAHDRLRAIEQAWRSRGQ